MVTTTTNDEATTTAAAAATTTTTAEPATPMNDDGDGGGAVVVGAATRRSVADSPSSGALVVRCARKSAPPPTTTAAGALPRNGLSSHFISLLFLSALLLLSTSDTLFLSARAQLPPPVTVNFKCLVNGCCDQHEWCRFWASIGECQNNAEFMVEACQLACNTCSGPQTPPAVARPQQLPADTGAAPTRLTQQQPPQRSRESAERAAVASRQQQQQQLPGGGGATSCAQIRAQPNNAFEQLSRSGLLNPVEDVSARQTLSLDEVSAAVNSGCVPELSSADCSASLCYHLIYRSMDGACNNLERPLFGAAFRHYMRLLPAAYDNGFEAPVSSLTNSRPSARELTATLLSGAQVVPHAQINSLLMQWGQFMSHDMARTTLQLTANCPSCSPLAGKCTPVPVPANDKNAGFAAKQCIKVSRAAPVCGTGNANTPRQQLNENTAFIDGSAIYGSSSRDLPKFRDGRTGFLRMSRFNNNNVLPFDESKCTGRASCAATFAAGDIRVNMFLGLSSMQILFAREHNRVAAILQRLNAAWSGDRVFQEARKIVGAEIQAITYNEYLPRVLGASFERLVGASYAGYDRAVDASVSLAFTSAAYRFGHGMLLESYPRLEESGQQAADGPFPFGEGVFKSQKILFEGGIDPVLRGLMHTPIKLPRRMTPAVTEELFGSTDLGSLNVQRGRDMGIPSYNRWRTFCGLSSASTFADVAEVSDASLRAQLASFYKTPDDADLYVAGMVEDAVPGGIVGPTFACIIGDQFKRSRNGDRFYFENPGIFTSPQVAELRKASLARVLCDNADRIASVPAQAMLLPSAAGMQSCNQLGGPDLTKWRE